MKYKIYKKAKSSMQSGLNNTRKWCLEPLTVFDKKICTKFSWTASENSLEQVKVMFDSLESAVFFAKKNNLSYQVFKPNKKETKIKSYAENFKPKPN